MNSKYIKKWYDLFESATTELEKFSILDKLYEEGFEDGKNFT